MFADDIDYFIHQFKTEDNAEYLAPDLTYLPVSDIVDTIKIKEKQNYIYYKSSIDGCPILSDKNFVPTNKNTKIKSKNNYLTYK
jgi:hypothetical protein